ncbi:MAG: ATP-binding protein [Verrucomicrobiota bacterium]
MAEHTMASFNSSFLDKILGRIDRLDTEGIQNVVQRLEEQRQLFETVFNVIEDGILVVNPKGRIQYCNQAARDLLSSGKEPMEQRSVHQLIPAFNWDHFVDSMSHEAAPSMVRLEYALTYPKTCFLRLYGAAIQQQNQENTGYVLVLHDVTESRKKTVEAIESERVHTLTLLASSVAHEIGNPLNALHIHLQLIGRETAKIRDMMTQQRQLGKRGRGRPPKNLEAEVGALNMEQSLERLEEFVSVSRGEINRLELIITQFLQAMRPTIPDRKPDHLNAIVIETIELLRPELANRGIELVEELDEQLPDPPLDRAQIKQVLVNLIKNAMQAMDKDGLLRIRTKRDADGVWLSVEDNGMGISKDRISRIFEPYYTTKRKGTGLGLMIVHRIIRDHGGRIMVEPNQPSGTIFRLWLPLFEQQEKLLGPS